MHGKPHNPEGYDTVNFYATTHIGLQALWLKKFPFSTAILRKYHHTCVKGATHSDIAVYLPLEDAWCKGVMPKESSLYGRGVTTRCAMLLSEELTGFRPTWINLAFLEKHPL